MEREWGERKGERVREELKEGEREREREGGGGGGGVNEWGGKEEEEEEARKIEGEKERRPCTIHTRTTRLYNEKNCYYDPSPTFRASKAGTLVGVF